MADKTAEAQEAAWISAGRPICTICFKFHPPPHVEKDAEEQQRTKHLSAKKQKTCRYRENSTDWELDTEDGTPSKLEKRRAVARKAWEEYLERNYVKFEYDEFPEVPCGRCEEWHELWDFCEDLEDLYDTETGALEKGDAVESGSEEDIVNRWERLVDQWQKDRQGEQEAMSLLDETSKVDETLERNEESTGVASSVLDYADKAVSWTFGVSFRSQT